MITSLTRRQSYNNVLRGLGTRQAQVLTELLCFQEPVTASELALEMHSIGFFRSSDRNNVHPRLNEMVELGVVTITGKRQCMVTNRTVAVYKVNTEVVDVLAEVLV